MNRRFSLTLCFAIGMAGSLPAAISKEEAWTVRYDGPGFTPEGSQAIAVDGDGNVYVAGDSLVPGHLSRTFLLKYDPSGTRLWVATEESLVFVGMTLDHDRNIWLHGYVTLPDSQSYAKVLKYDAGGNLLWKREYHDVSLWRMMAIADSGEVYFAHVGEVVKISPAGDIIWTIAQTSLRKILVLNSDHTICVVSQPNGSGKWITTKYDAGGAKVWESEYQVPEQIGVASSISAVASDPAGNIYIAGQSYSQINRYDCLILKYDPQGTLGWDAHFDRGLRANEYATGIAVDSSGTVAIAGYVDGSGLTGKDVLLLKFDAQGQNVWAAEFDGPISQDDVPAAVALTSDGNAVLCAGIHSSAIATDLATLKFDGQGKILWKNIRPGSPSAMAVNGAGEILVTGSTPYDREAFVDSLTFKLGGDGREIWSDRYGGTCSALDSAAAMATDSLGNVFVTGSSNPSPLDISTGQNLCVTMKYDRQGNQVWATRYDSPEMGDDAPAAIAVDTEGNACVVLRFDRSSTGEVEVVTLKFDPQGSLLWQSRFKDSGSEFRYPVAIAADDHGNIYVGGSGGESFVNSYVILKYSPAGSLLWSERFSDQVQMAATAMALDRQGNVIITGYRGGPPFTTAQTLKYSPEGKRQWIQICCPEGFTIADAIAIDNSGDILIAGRTLKVLKYDPDGKLIWASTGYQDPQYEVGLQNLSFTIDRAGNSYLAGTFTVPHFTDRFMVTRKLAVDGSELWAAKREADFDHILVIEGLGRVVVASQGLTTFQDPEPWFEIVEYDSAGKEVGAVSRSGIPIAMAGTPAGSFYLASSTSEGDEISDISISSYRSAALPFLRGDCSGDGRLGGVSDAIFVLHYLFLGDVTPPCLSACDFDGDGQVSGSPTDAIALLHYSFLGGAPPPAPFPACSADFDDVLGCAGPPACH